MKKLIRLIFATLFFVSHIGYAQDLAPKYSNEFLQVGVGARALGMGNALVSSVNDVTSVYWNPAGLTRQEKRFDVGLMHSEYFAGIAKYDYIGLSYKIDEKSAVGFAGIRFGVDDIPNTTQLVNNEGQVDYDRITLFSAADYGFIFSYAREMPIPGLTFGGSVKVIYRKAGDFAKSWGFGLDAGIQYNLNDKWYFGLMARDVTSTFNAWTYNLDDDMKEVFIQTGNEIPENGLELTLPRFIFGASRKIDIGWQNFYIIPEVNVVMTTDGKRNTLLKSKVFSFDPVVGLEINWNNTIAVRTGVNNFQYAKNFDDSRSLMVQPNIGVGLTLKGITLDYSFTNISSSKEALFSHVISLRFGFK
ncbi:MAG: PorV/PorQ family protein [Brumimicrobium sp.]